MVKLTKLATKKAPQRKKAPPCPEVKEKFVNEDIFEEEAEAVTIKNKAVNDEKAATILQSEANDEQQSYEAPVTPAKRKTDTKDEETARAKKAKSDEEGFTLFVGNLNAEKDCDEIKSAIANFFLKQGLEVQDVRLAVSKNFGHVDLSSEEEIQKALELNGRNIMDQPVKLDRATIKENFSKKAVVLANKLLINNLPYSTTEDTLRDMFTKAVSIRIPQKDDKSLGYAYLEFESAEDARVAKMSYNHSEIEGRHIIIGYSYTGEERESREAGRRGNFGPSSSSNQVFINNMSFSVTEDSIQHVFEKAVAIRIPLNQGHAQKYAFLEFKNVKDATETLSTCNKMRIQGKSIKLEFNKGNKEIRSRGRRHSEPTKTLIVKGLSEETTDQTLKGVFEAAVSARIIVDRHTGFSKGFGFVEFDSEEDCKAAFEAMEDCEIQGNRVALGYAQPKSQEKGQDSERSGFTGRGAKRGSGFERGRVRGGRAGGRGGCGN